MTPPPKGASPKQAGSNIRDNPAKKLVPTASYNDTSMCALVLEDVPAASDDSRLVFETFPGTLEQSYSLSPYRKIGGNRMPQPSFATYQGGDWGPFPLTLKFRAAERVAVDPNNLAPADLEGLLIEMERKVNWTEAICFPLERANLEAQRIVARASASNAAFPSAAATDAAAKLRRNDPPFILIVIGSWRTIRGYCTNWRCTWEGPWHPISARPYGATVSMTFVPIMPEYPTFQTIRDQAKGFTVASPGASPGLAGQAVLRAQAERAATAQRQQDNAAALNQVRVPGQTTLPNV
jgi:hypothetical protein